MKNNDIKQQVFKATLYKNEKFTITDYDGHTDYSVYIDSNDYLCVTSTKDKKSIELAYFPLYYTSTTLDEMTKIIQVIINNNGELLPIDSIDDIKNKIFESINTYTTTVIENNLGINYYIYASAGQLRIYHSKLELSIIVMLNTENKSLNDLASLVYLLINHY